MKQVFPASRLCIVTAVDIEFSSVAGLLAERSHSSQSGINSCHGHFGDRRVTVLKSEIGAIGFADRLANHLKDNRYDALIVAGFAGALDLNLKTGDAVIFDLCCDARAHHINLNSRKTPLARDENASIACHAQATEFIFEILRESGFSCFRGAGVTVDQIITKAADKLSLGIRYDALAVDMETYDVLGICAASDLAAAVIRIVSDEAHSDLPDFNRALHPDGSMNPWRTASVMIASPINSTRFLLGLRTAVNALQANLKAILSA
jgi:nucleoside phosphorylase